MCLHVPKHRPLMMMYRQIKAPPSQPGTTAPNERLDSAGNERFEAMRNVLRTLIFYDLFGCPVLLKELPHRTIGGLPEEWRADPQAMIEADPLLPQHVTVSRGYVFLRTAPVEFDRWKAAECTRRQCIRKYEKWIRLFCRIPFVRMIAVTGSLSFPMPSKEPDCDLFVMTARNRLWIVVALSRLMFFRILPLLRLVKYGDICPNYMIEADVPSGGTSDLFDSMQMAAMNLVVGRDVYDRFVTSHSGLKEFFPHWSAKDGSALLFDRVSRSPPHLVRNLAEMALWPFPLDRLNRWLYRRLSRRFASSRRDDMGSPETGGLCDRILTPWVQQAFDLISNPFQHSLTLFKVHGNQKLRLLARYDEALRRHSASSIDLTGDVKFVDRLDEGKMGTENQD